MTASSNRQRGAQGPSPFAEVVVPKVTSRICGLPFLVQIAPLLSRTELVTATPLLVDASHCTPKSNVKRFILTRPKPAYGRQGLDWIVRPGYRHTGSMATNHKHL